MIHEPAVETMTERVNQELAVRHQKHTFVCPAKIQIRSRMLNLVDLGENLLIRHRSLGKPRQSVVLPYLPCLLILVLFYRPAASNENDDEEGDREPNDHLAIDSPRLMEGDHWSTFRLTDAAPVTPQLEQRRHRGIRCSQLVRHHTPFFHVVTILICSWVCGDVSLPFGTSLRKCASF